MAWPWDNLKDLDVDIDWQAKLPPSVEGLSEPDDDGTGWAALRADLTPLERTATLAHELVHLERGGPSQHPDGVVRRREEAWVDREAARRLLPVERLLEWVGSLEEGATLTDAEEALGRAGWVVLRVAADAAAERRVVIERERAVLAARVAAVFGLARSSCTCRCSEVHQGMCLE